MPPGEDRSVSASETDSAIADADAAKAALVVSRNALTLAKANQEEADVNFGYTTIKSPVKGVIVDRRVNLGQLVNASALRSQPLFDRQGSESHANLGERERDRRRSDSSRPARVRFSVAAFPKETFFGKVDQIRLNASMSQSVVTYTVVVVVDNRRQASSLSDGAASIRG